MERQTKKIDATGKAFGRLATEIVLVLRGKDKPDFAPNKDAGDFVLVENFGQVKITGKKLKNKVYYRPTTRPGKLKQETMTQVIEKKGMQEIVKRAVYGMLPTNKLRPKMMKRLTFK